MPDITEDDMLKVREWCMQPPQRAVLRCKHCGDILLTAFPPFSEECQTKQRIARWQRKFNAHMRGIELMFRAFWPESYCKEHWR